MLTVREALEDITYHGSPLPIVAGNPYAPANSDESKDKVLIPMTDGNAITGADAVLEANHRALEALWEDSDALTIVSSGYSQLIGLLLDAEAPDDLESTISSLDDYPVVCESTLSEVEREWADAYWERFGRDDVRDTLSEDESERVSDTDIDAAFDYWHNNSDYGAYLDGDILIFDEDCVGQAVREVRNLA